MNDAQINQIVEQVVRRLSSELGAAPSSVPATHRGSSAPAFHSRRPGIFDDLDHAGEAATQAFKTWGATSLETRAKVVESMREMTRKHATELAEMAVSETALGNVKDKINKNLLVANKTPGIEILRPVAYSGADGSKPG